MKVDSLVYFITGELDFLVMNIPGSHDSTMVNTLGSLLQIKGVDYK
jgi:hypothetical protein